MLYALVEEDILIHGARTSRLVRILAAGTPACLTVTNVTGLVLARSAFEHSANYESVTVLGSFAPVKDRAEMAVAFEAFVEKLLPGRWGEIRHPNGVETRATSVLALPLDEASAKIRSGPPDDSDTPDAALDVWAGVIPLRTTIGTPERAPGLRAGYELSKSVLDGLAKR